MNEQNHYKQDKTKEGKSINVISSTLEKKKSNQDNLHQECHRWGDQRSSTLGEIVSLNYIKSATNVIGLIKSPPEGYEDLSLRAIHYTGYLPLALKVFGSFFRGREAIVWESAFNRLAKEPNIEIFETLKLSFDVLQGKEKEHVTRILDSFGFNAVIGISTLIEKSLITVSNAKLDMHDLIQDMGLKIAHESFFQSRLWELEDIHDVVNMNGVTTFFISL
nr:hypothetical protein [Tanacetum cinerariifolium]